MIRAFLLIFLLAGCDFEHDVDADHDLSFDGEIVVAKPRFKQVDGIVYAQFDGYCMAIDASTVYPAAWVYIDVFDDARYTPYTTVENGECD